MNRKIKYGISILVALFVIVAAFAGIELRGYADANLGIYGNGTNGIYIDINAAPYTTYAQKAYGNYAYSGEGCAWFASSRVNQLTGRDSQIYSGMTWYNTAYSYYGYSRGSVPKAKALACYENHVSVVEIVEGDTITLSEGGYTIIGEDYGYCIIHTMTREKLESARAGAFIGYVYIDYEDDKEPPVVSNGRITDIDENGYTIKVKASDNISLQYVRCATWTSLNGQDDLIWKEMSYNNGEYELYVKFSDHGNEYGTYINHIYAWDTSGNQCTSIQAIEYENKKPEFKAELLGNDSSAEIGNFTGDKITLKAAAKNGSGDYEYKFIIYNVETGEWYRLRDYSDSNTYSWSAGSSGYRKIYVDVKDNTGNVVRSNGIVVKSSDGLKVSATGNKNSMTVGDSTVISATASGGSGGYRYSYIIHNTDTNSWYRLADNLYSSTYTWKATTPGNRNLYVDVKDNAGKVVRSNGIKLSVNNPENLSVTLTASANTVNTGETVTLSAKASGGTGGYTYSYLVYNKTTGEWYRFSDFSGISTLKWKAGSQGTRLFYVEVKDGSGKVVRSQAQTILTK